MKLIRASEWRQSAGEIPSRIVLMEDEHSFQTVSQDAWTHRFATAVQLAPLEDRNFVNRIWGHYDMSEAEASADFETRVIRNAFGRFITEVD